MSKPRLYGLVVLGCGAVVGLITGGPIGLVFAAVCLVVGLVLLVAYEAMGIKQKRSSAKTLSALPAKTPVLVLVKEVHARPHRNGRFQEISDPNQTDLQFEVFANCWLISESLAPLAITEVQLAIRKADGSPVGLERVPNDLQNWRLGRLKDDLDSWGVRYLQAAQEEMAELDVTEPLQGGVARAGWLHCRIQNTTPSDVKAASIELTAKDSHGLLHVGVARGPHNVPGRVWPFHDIREDAMDQIAQGAAEYTADQLARSIELSGQLIKRYPPEQRKREQKIIDKMKAILAKKRAEESATQDKVKDRN